jgi:hypothetical protein
MMMRRRKKSLLSERGRSPFYQKEEAAKYFDLNWMRRRVLC